MRLVLNSSVTELGNMPCFILNMIMANSRFLSVGYS